MRAAGGQQERRGQPDPIEFVPKQGLEQAERQIERQRREIERLHREIERLRQELEAALRAGRRQAAPHSRGKTNQHPKRPGRKPGRDYGKHACRRTPSRVDETIPVPLPPQGGRGVEFQCHQAQHQEGIVRRTVVRR